MTAAAMQPRKAAAEMDLGSARRARHIDPGLVGSVAALLLFGLLVSFSASSRIGAAMTGDVAYFLKRQILWIGIGVVAGGVMLSVDYRVWRRYSVLLMICTLLGLALMLVLGSEVFGAGRWLLASGSIQPSELAKLTVVIYVADWLSGKRDEIRDLQMGLIPFAILVGLICGLVVMQNDLSTALVIGLVASAMFFTAGAHLGQMLGAGAVASLVVALFIASSPFRRGRIRSFLDPMSDPTGEGFQVIRSLVSFQNGGLFGVGLGQGQEKEVLPAPHTDAIFAVLGEELGLAGSLLMLAIFAFFIWRGLRIAAGAPDRFSSLLATGLTAWIGIQALVNMAVATKSIPPTGIPLPMVSFGGSSMISCLMAVGLLANLSRRIDPKRAGLHVHLDLGRGKRRTRLSRAHRARSIGR